MANNFQITALNQQGVATVLHPESNADQVLPGINTKVPLRTEITKWNERADEVETARDGKANLKAKIDDVVTKLTGSITTVRTNLEETISLLDSKTTAEDARLLGRMDGIKTNLQTQIDVWNNFKTNGGTIGGSIIVGNENSKAYQSIGIKRQKATTNEQFILFQDINNENDYGALGFIYDGGQTGIRIGKNKTIIPNDNGVSLGTPQTPWKEVFIQGENKAQNGYFKATNGFIIQFMGGSAANDEWGFANHFPISFPNVCLSVVATPHGNGLNQHIAITDFTKDWAKVRGSSSYNCRIIAIGY